jgi:hypothetical protein
MRTFIGLPFTWLPNRVRPDRSGACSLVPTLPMKMRSLATPDYLGSEPKTFDNRSAQKTALCYHILKSHILVGGIADQNGIAPESA